MYALKTEGGRWFDPTKRGQLSPTLVASCVFATPNDLFNALFVADGRGYRCLAPKLTLVRVENGWQEVEEIV